MLPRALAWYALPALAACAAPKDAVRRDSVDTLPPSVVRDSVGAATTTPTPRDTLDVKTPTGARPEPKPNATKETGRTPNPAAPAPTDSPATRPAPPKRVIHDPVLPPVDSGRPAKP